MKVSHIFTLSRGKVLSAETIPMRTRAKATSTYEHNQQPPVCMLQDCISRGNPTCRMFPFARDLRYSYEYGHPSVTLPLSSPQCGIHWSRSKRSQMCAAGDHFRTVMTLTKLIGMADLRILSAVKTFSHVTPGITSVVRVRGFSAVLTIATQSSKWICFPAL